MSDRSLPVYKCTLNNRTIILKEFQETTDGITVSAPILVGKHHKNGSRELAVQALKIPGSRVVLTMNSDEVNMTVHMPSYCIQRKLVEPIQTKSTKSTKSSDSATRAAQIFDFRLCCFGIHFIPCFELELTNVAGEIFFKVKQLHYGDLYKHNSQNPGFSLEIFQTFSLQNKRSRNWTSFLPESKFVVDESSIVDKELPISDFRQPSKLNELTFSGKVVNINQ